MTGEYFGHNRELITESELNNSALKLQSEQVDVPVDFKEIPSLHLGERKHKEVTIETYFPKEGNFFIHLICFVCE